MKKGMIQSLRAVALVASVSLLTNAQAATSGGTILQFDFNSASSWTTAPQKNARVMASPVGTIDNANSTEPSGGLLLTANPAAPGNGRAQLGSGLLAVQNDETNLGKLTLAFSLSASSARPVEVRVESFNRKKKRTGGLETTIYPAAANFYQRFALDLSRFQAEGKGKFAPDSPFVGFTFSIRGDDWKGVEKPEIRLDNVQYAKPAFYVSAQGNDTNDGRTEKTAFATPQKALDLAGPGDIIVVMNGTYGKVEGTPAQTPVANFMRPGTPAGWIVLKNYPGQQPVFSSAGQQGVRISRPSGSTEPPLCYIEVRGLDVRGNGDTAKEQFPGDIGTFSPNTHMQGIHVNGAGSPGKIVHHIRLADNKMEFCTANGLYVDYADWIYVENNEIRNNCWTTIDYAPAGMAVMHYADFDGTENTHKFLISGNQVSGNRLTVFNSPWGQPVKTSYFNGDGILLDANAEKPPAVYHGRTLVQNNLVFNNGAGGIQMWGGNRIDIVNNTIYFNGATPQTRWGQIGVERCRDVRILNNIIAAQPDRPLNTWFLGRADSNTADIMRVGNLYFGGGKPPVAGEGDIIADPMFVNPSDDAAVANFRLKPGSPAVGKARTDVLIPANDLSGRPRGASFSVGAYENSSN